MASAKRCRCPVDRVVEARSACEISTHAAPRSLGGSGGQFRVHLTCHAERSLEFRRRGHGTDVRWDEEEATETTFAVHDAADLLTDDACSRLVRWILVQRPPLQTLRLTDEELDDFVGADIVRRDVVQKMVRQAQLMDEMGVVGAGVVCTFFVDVSVHLRVIHSVKALLMACKPKAAAAGGDDECAICYGDLEVEASLELPVCAHAFHRRCISKWFNTAATCPMCRGDNRPCVLL